MNFISEFIKDFITRAPRGNDAALRAAMQAKCENCPKRYTCPVLAEAAFGSESRIRH